MIPVSVGSRLANTAVGNGHNGVEEGVACDFEKQAVDEGVLGF